MIEYKLKRIGVANYMSDIKYELYKSESLIAVIYTKDEDIKSVINKIYMNISRDLGNEFIILIDNEEE